MGPRPDRHLEDRPRFCPGCGAEFAEAFAVEYWEADRRVYHSWCRACGWTGDIALVQRMIGHEAADD